MSAKDWALVWFGVPGVTLALMGLIRLVFAHHFDAWVLGALKRRSGDWQKLAKEEFHELFTAMASTQSLQAMVDRQATENHEMRQTLIKAMDMVPTLASKIEHLDGTLERLGRAVDKLETVPERMAVLDQRVSTVERLLPPQRKRSTE